MQIEQALTRDLTNAVACNKEELVDYFELNFNADNSGAVETSKATHIEGERLDAGVALHNGGGIEPPK